MALRVSAGSFEGDSVGDVNADGTESGAGAMVNLF